MWLKCYLRGNKSSLLCYVSGVERQEPMCYPELCLIIIPLPGSPLHTCYIIHASRPAGQLHYVYFSGMTASNLLQT